MSVPLSYLQERKADARWRYGCPSARRRSSNALGELLLESCVTPPALWEKFTLKTLARVAMKCSCWRTNELALGQDIMSIHKDVYVFIYIY